MRAACIQLYVEPCGREENLRRALELARSAIGRGAEILVYPELFLTGFCYATEADDAVPYPSLEPFRALAREHSCLIAGSIRSGRQNLGFCLDSESLDLRPKIHPFGVEKEHFDGGDFISPVATPWGMAGLEVCYDLRFPEVARALALKGADFLITVAQFPASRIEQWRVLCIARAIENQIPHLACNYSEGGTSIIVDAGGGVQAEAGPGETVIFGEIDLEERDAVRHSLPCLSDRRPEVY
ncbi:MAG: C-N hydrolase family amidase [Methanosaeta sp. PtaU1.Bin060]|nr:MAG: C-N hydrolase family amidase [Methanosaeta sp. PtaU1.Bin060]